MRVHLLNVIENTRGRIFRATFTKRTTGEVRNLVGRLGVTKYLKGGGLKFSPKDKGLIVVFDMVKKQYRMINLETLTEVKFQGRVHRSKDFI